MQLTVNQRVYPRDINFEELNERLFSEGKKTELKRCQYYRLQLRATFALLSQNLDKKEWMTFIYTISPTGFVLRKGCESCTIHKDEEDITLTVTVKPNSKVLTVIDRINPLESGLKVKKLNCVVQAGIQKK